MPQADNANASVGFTSIMVQKSAVFPAKLLDPLKSLYCGTWKHDEVKRRHKTPTKMFLWIHFPFILLIYLVTLELLIYIIV